MTVKTQPAVLTAAQSERLLNRGRDVRAVLVDGVVVGLYARNKYGMTIGTFDPLALTAEENPFVATRVGYSPMPAGRSNGRKVKDLVNDIVNRVPSRAA